MYLTKNKSYQNFRTIKKDYHVLISDKRIYGNAFSFPIVNIRGFGEPNVMKCGFILASQVLNILQSSIHMHQWEMNA